MKQFAILLTMVGLATLSVGCTSYWSESNHTVRKEMNEFKAQMTEKLKTVEVKIDKLEQKAKAEKAETKKKIEAKVENLKEMKKDVVESLEELVDKTEDEYADFKLKVEHNYELLANEIEKVVN